MLGGGFLTGSIVALFAQIVKMGFCPKFGGEFCALCLFTQIALAWYNNIKLYKGVKAMDKPKVSKKQQACVNRYIGKAYDRINLTVPKGDKDIIKARADSLGKSVNAYIHDLIENDLKR